MKIFRILLVFVFLVATGSAVHAKKVDLKYKLEPGAEFKLQVSLLQEIAQEVMGQSQATKNLMETKYLLKVLEKTAEGNFLMESRQMALKIKIENEYINLDFDSESGEEAPEALAPAVKTIDIPLTFIISPRGEIIEIRDAEKYLGVMKAAMDEAADEMQQMITAMAAQTNSEEGLIRQLSGLFIKYPEGKTKTGDSWNDESTDMMQMLNFKNVITNTLVNADKKNASLKQSVDIKQLDMAGMEIQGMTMSYELSGRKESGYVLDLANGMISNMDGVTDITGVMSIESPQLPSPMSIPMTIKMTESLKRLD